MPEMRRQADASSELPAACIRSCGVRPAITARSRRAARNTTRNLGPGRPARGALRRAQKPGARRNPLVLLVRSRPRLLRGFRVRAHADSRLPDNRLRLLDNDNLHTRGPADVVLGDVRFIRPRAENQPRRSEKLAAFSHISVYLRLHERELPVLHQEPVNQVADGFEPVRLLRDFRVGKVVP